MYVRGQKSVCDPLDLELQVVVSYLTWVLGTENLGLFEEQPSIELQTRPVLGLSRRVPHSSVL